MTTPDLWQRVSRTLPSRETRHCRTDDELERLLHSGQAGAVVWEIGARLGRGMARERDLLRQASDVAGMLVVGSVSVHLLDALMAIGNQARAVRVSIDGYHALHVDVARFAAAARRPSPNQLLVTHLARSGVPAADAIIAAAVSIGERRTRVAGLAKACGLPQRTLEWRLQSADVLPARDLLGAVLCLHVLWKLEILDEPLKRVAREAGFSGAVALSNYVARHAHDRPARLVTQDSFAAMLSRTSVKRGSRGVKRVAGDVISLRPPSVDRGL